MVIRNFWVEVQIDGRESTLRGGPAAKEGGMKITLYQSELGQISKALEINCERGGFVSGKEFEADPNGLFLRSTVSMNDNKNTVASVTTLRKRT